MSPADPLPVPGLPASWERRGKHRAPEPPPLPQSPGERVLARILALGDAPTASADYRLALHDVLGVLTDEGPRVVAGT